MIKPRTKTSFPVDGSVIRREDVCPLADHDRPGVLCYHACSMYAETAGIAWRLAMYRRLTRREKS